MEPIPFETGRVVTSTQGRDRKRSFVVIAPPQDGYVLMADGLTRKLDHPKKKKQKHLRPRPVLMDSLETLRAERRLKDSDVRSFLKENGYGPEQPLKED
jgi:ribosomal protein L14E/L6E/L27E